MNAQLFTGGALLGGMSIGLFFFGGLWWTVQRAMSSRQPGLLFAGSFLLRTLLTLTAFYFIGGASWQRVLACLIGFIFGRILVKRFSRLPSQTYNSLPKEGVR